MRILALAFSLFVLSGGKPDWRTDFAAAKAEAGKTDKYLLLNFSGSDWCIPCIKMEKRLFETETFASYAEKNLVLVKADFPRLRKNGLTKEQVAQNESLAAKYNRQGKFPLTLLLDKNGKTLRQWDGLPNETPEAFTAEINTATHAGK